MSVDALDAWQADGIDTILEGLVALRREVDRMLGCDVLSATLPMGRLVEQPFPTTTL
jgi:hypothetical protein